MRKMEDGRQQVAQKEVAARRATDRRRSIARSVAARHKSVSIPATTPVPRDAGDDYGRYQHYGNGRGHEASKCDTPHARHSKVRSSGNPPKRSVRRTSFMG